jgi:hypothetical protein
MLCWEELGSTNSEHMSDPREFLSFLPRYLMRDVQVRHHHIYCHSTIDKNSSSGITRRHYYLADEYPHHTIHTNHKAYRFSLDPLALN